MRMYYVTYDYLIGNRYYEQHKRFFANNAREACATIKNNYWERIDFLIEKCGYSYNKARRSTKWPFHIKATRK